MIESCAGKWIVEVAELSGMSRAEVEKVKAQLSRTTDRARLSYARFRSEVPRSFIAVGRRTRPNI
jgi:predicted P-loop ATPase